MDVEDVTVNKIDEDLNLLIRHIKMLRVTKENQPIGIIRLSEMTDIPKHKIRYSLRLLEKDGVIAPSPGGAVVTDKYEAYMKGILEYMVKLRESVDVVESMLRDALE
jgi:predicted transcriptional regulator